MGFLNFFLLFWNHNARNVLLIPSLILFFWFILTREFFLPYFTLSAISPLHSASYTETFFHANIYFQMQIGRLQIRCRKDAFCEMQKTSHCLFYSSKLLVFQLAQEWQFLSIILSIILHLYFSLLFHFTWHMNSWGFFNSVHMLHFLVFSNYAITVL